MRILLAIVMTLGLIVNSGGVFMSAAHAKAHHLAIDVAHADASASQKHSHEAQDSGCHHSHAPVDQGTKHDCCGKKGTCPHDTCSCLKCVNSLADVQALNLARLSAPAVHFADDYDSPPGSARVPPSPPPQS